MTANTRKGLPFGTEIQTGQLASNITAAETNQLTTKPGKVGQVIVYDVGTTATIDLYDHASSNSNKMWGWVSANGVGVFALQLPIQAGIRVVTGGTFGGCTVVYSDTP